MLVIADTSPLNYLILIDAVELLPRLYQRVILPETAWEELKHPRAPAAVSQWAHALPVWIELRSAPDYQFDSSLAALGRESEAITLAEHYRQDSEVLLLLDEERARQHAAVRHLNVTGTLGILKSAAANGWIDLAATFARLRQTNFRISTRFLNEMLLDPDARPGGPTS